ncbi:hypothetical protein SAMN02990966_04398 [Rhodospirillales bacterium URHD0017]|nr:hypothetical protein SAMN02990966_04398 [Rhodospirillales bacterium URHD0017]
MAAAATARVADGVYLGGEVRYLRAFDSMAFGNLVGSGGLRRADLLYRLGARRLAVRRLEHPGMGPNHRAGLDLAVFERHTFKIRLAIDL